MPAPDDSYLKALIDTNLADSPPGQPRSIKPAILRFTLKTLIDWVKTAINGNLSTWYKIGTANTPATNAEPVYRTGKVLIGSSATMSVDATLQVAGNIATRGIYAFNTQNNTNPMAAQDIGNRAGLQVHGNTTNNAAFMEFHVPGQVIHQFGVDTDGFLKLRPWSTSTSHIAVFDGYNTKIATNNVLASRKVVLYDTLNNDHQYYGFGVNASTLRYQVPSVADAHVFYSGDSPATSREILRLKGNGDVSVYQGNFEVSNVSNPIAGLRLNLSDNVITNSVFGEFKFQASAGASRYSSIRGLVGQFSDQVGMAFFTNTGATNYKEAARFLPSGFFGVGTTDPTSKLHIKGAAGHDQLRLENSYTPTGTNDPNGQTGQLAWDQNFIYVKVGGGWRRAALQSF